MKTYRKMSIEEKLDCLGKLVEQIHDKLDLHRWFKSYRPWNAIPDGDKKRHKCHSYCNHNEYYIECECGAEKKATKKQYNLAEASYDGY